MTEERIFIHVLKSFGKIADDAVDHSPDDGRFSCFSRRSKSVRQNFHAFVKNWEIAERERANHTDDQRPAQAIHGPWTNKDNRCRGDNNQEHRSDCGFTSGNGNAEHERGR